MVCSGGGGTRSRFTIMGSLNVGMWDGILTSVVVLSWSTLEHLVWTGIRQVISSVHLLIVSVVWCRYFFVVLPVDCVAD